MLTIRHAKGDLEEIERDLAVDLLGRGDPNLWFHFDTDQGGRTSIFAAESQNSRPHHGRHRSSKPATQIGFS